MVELRVQPIVGIVALLATRWETRRDVIGISGALEFRRMAAVTLRGEPLKLPGCRSLVASIAVCGRMRTDQGKPILVVADSLDRDIPAFDGVA